MVVHVNTQTSTDLQEEATSQNEVRICVRIQSILNPQTQFLFGLTLLLLVRVMTEGGKTR